MELLLGLAHPPCSHIALHSTLHSAVCSLRFRMWTPYHPAGQRGVASSGGCISWLHHLPVSHHHIQQPVCHQMLGHREPASWLACQDSQPASYFRSGSQRPNLRSLSLLGFCSVCTMSRSPANHHLMSVPEMCQGLGLSGYCGFN